MKDKQTRFLELYKPIHERFERFCRARVFGDMDFRDVINDSLLIAFDKFDTLKSKDAFQSFLFSICVRVVGNHYQKKREARVESESQFLNLVDHNNDPQSAADIHYLYEALARLSGEQRECIILFEISGFSIKEIMEIQQASESAVKQRLKRGREKLIGIMTYESASELKNVQHG